MKKSLLFFGFILFVFLICPVVYSQETNPKVRGQILEPCGQTGLYIVQIRKKTGLYDVAEGRYLIKPQIGYMFYAEAYNWLFVLGSDGSIKVYCLTESDTSKYVLFESKNGMVIQSANSYIKNVGEIMCYNKALNIETDSGWVQIPTILFDGWENDLAFDNSFSFGFQRDGENWIINNYHNCFRNDPLHAVSSVIYPGEDSIDASGNVLYYPRKNGYGKTGLYDLINAEWLINPVYNSIIRIDSVYFAVKTGSHNCDAEELVDIYKIDHDKIVLTEFQNQWTNGGFDANLVFSGNDIWRDRDSSFIYVRDEAGVRLYNLVLFNKYWLEYSDFPEKSIFRFKFDTTFSKPVEAIILCGRNEKWNVLFNNNSFDYYFFDAVDWIQPGISFQKSMYYIFNENTYSHYYIADDNWYQYFMWEDSLTQMDSPFTNMNKTNASRGIEKWDDSLVYVQHQIKEDWNNLQPLLSIQFPGEDSVDADGNLVYYMPYPGEYSSGIFNLKTNKWFTDEAYSWILKGQTGYLFCQPALNSDGYVVGQMYSLSDLNFQFMFVDVTMSELKLAGVELDQFGF
ncbi:MAG: hypothetical protein IPM77_03770 [Crocinitomicaceae bacterium]|nr:hypothetical protein [Crocinitomicaceae bacterium]